MQESLLTAEGVAKVLGISRSLAYRLIAQGDIRALRFGRVVRVSQEALEAFIERNSSGGEADAVAPFRGYNWAQDPKK